MAAARVTTSERGSNPWNAASVRYWHCCDEGGKAPVILSNAELRAKLDTQQEPKVRKWLNDRNIAWDKDAKGKAMTTLSAIEEHLFKKSSEEVSF